MNAVVILDEKQKLAADIVKSGLFGYKSAEQVMAMMAVCESEGLHPARAVTQYHIIQGRPALKADALLTRFHNAGGRHEFTVFDNEKVTGRFTHSQGGTVEVTWTLKDAQRAGLTNKEVWRQYPRAMLKARVIGEGVRAVYPGAANGVYTYEEVRDFGPGPVAAFPHSTTPTLLPGPDQEADDLERIETAPDEQSLKHFYVAAVKLARAAGDLEGLARLEAAKDKRKAELAAITQEQNDGV